ncbi:MAG: hypothetical protein JEY96_04000 [Bacteroidales bacterium]|jgi:hypothetical protein|nr:hypothetical protein [Bacteroidales bacterium]
MSDINIKNFWDEEWKDLVLENMQAKSKYKISNYGRILSYYYKEEGVLLRPKGPNGYKAFVFRDKDGKTVRMYIHRLVAMFFLDKPREDQQFVIHFDSANGNNYYKNLCWANDAEKREHQNKHMPNWQNNNKDGLRPYAKLTETQVKLIKRKINDPNRKTRMKIIAKRYGISLMQLYRIKSGENWGNVNPD